MASADFDQAIAESHAATDGVLKGNPDGFKALYSRSEDITLGNPFGGFARGWDQVAEQLERASSYYRDGEATGFESVARAVGAELAYTVELERAKAKVAGSSGVREFAVRVTSIYRNEADGWRLIHRHADPRVSRQTAESVLEG
jgi:ketosteroid isomerase-like protein